MTPGFEAGTVLGHEFVGVVARGRSRGPRFRPGHRVVNTSMISLRHLRRHCRAGRAAQCPGRALFGYSGVYQRLDGGQAELVRVPVADRCCGRCRTGSPTRPPCSWPTCCRPGTRAIRRAGVVAGDAVCVLGCGTVGLMAVLCALDAGARVIAVDGMPARRALAERFGARAVAPHDAAEAIAALTGGLGADGVIEAAGVPAALTPRSASRAAAGWSPWSAPTSSRTTRSTTGGCSSAS